MDTRPFCGCALLAAMQTAPQHPQIIIYQPENPGMKKTAALRSAHSAVEARLRSAGCSHCRRWGSGPRGVLEETVRGTRDSPLKDSGIL